MKRIKQWGIFLVLFIFAVMVPACGGGGGGQSSSSNSGDSSPTSAGVTWQYATGSSSLGNGNYLVGAMKKQGTRTGLALFKHLNTDGSIYYTVYYNPGDGHGNSAPKNQQGVMTIGSNGLPSTILFGSGEKLYFKNWDLQAGTVIVSSQDSNGNLVASNKAIKISQSDISLLETASSNITAGADTAQAVTSHETARAINTFQWVGVLKSCALLCEGVGCITSATVAAGELGLDAGSDASAALSCKDFGTGVYRLTTDPGYFLTHTDITGPAAAVITGSVGLDPFAAFDVGALALTELASTFVLYPPSITSVTSSSDSIELTFSPPTNSGITVAGYTIEWSTSQSDLENYDAYNENQSSDVTFLPVPATKTTTTINNLPSGKVIYIAIKSVDGAGNESAPNYTHVATDSAIAVTITPRSEILQAGGSVPIKAIVTQAKASSAISWAATDGTFSQTTSDSGAVVTYTAPQTPDTYAITATSTADSTKIDQIPVTVVAAPQSGTSSTISAPNIGAGNTSLIVPDSTNIDTVDAQFLKIMESAGSEVTVVGAKQIANGTVNLSNYSTLACFAYGDQSVVSSITQTVADDIIDAVKNGEIFVTNREAGGAQILSLEGYASATAHSGWYPALHDSNFVQSLNVSNNSLLEGVTPFNGDQNNFTVDQLDSMNTPALIFRVDNSKSYGPGLYEVTGSYTVTPSRYLIEQFSTGWNINPSGDGIPEFDVGKGHIIVIGALKWTFDQSTGSGGTIGPAGIKMLQNIGAGLVGASPIGYNSGGSSQSGDSIVVTDPSSGDNWQRGTAQMIKWTSTGTIDNVEIQIEDKNGYYTTIISSVPNNGSYTWSIPTNGETGSGFRIRVSDVNNWGGTYGFSSTFSLN